MNSYHIEQLNWIEKWPPLSIRWHCRFFNWMTSNTRMANAKSGFIYELTKRSAYFMAHETVPNRRYLLLSLSLTLRMSHSLHVFSFSLFYFSNGFSGLLANNSHCFTWRRTMKCHRKCEMTVYSGHGIETFFFRLFSFLYVFNSKAKCQSFYYLALIQWIRKQKGRKKERDRREKKDKHKMCATIKQLALYWTHSQREAKRKTNEHIVNQFWKKGGMCQI